VCAYELFECWPVQGRAGRPQFDTSGVAVIMTHAATQGRYKTITSGSEPVESTLNSSLTEHVVSEIALRTIVSLQSGLTLLKSTFLSIRMRRFGL
jgi:ATP-dependent DNA helicase HFM1/MER3